MLFLLPSLGGGGAERVIVTVLRYLDHNRFAAAVAVVNGKEDTYRSELPAVVQYVDLGCERVRYAAPALLRLIWRRRPDVVISNIMHLNLAIAMLKPFLPPGTRIIARESSVLNASLPDTVRGRAERALYRRYYRRFDHVICQSQAMRAELVGDFHVPVSATSVIRNPVDSARVRTLAAQPLPAFARLLQPYGSEAVRLVAAGRLAREKGFDILLHALAACPASVSLTLLGDGPLRAELQHTARLLGLEERVQIVGFQSNPYPFFRHASALVLSSRHESFPNVVLEALACGTPVIATPALGGTREILEGQPGCTITDTISATSLARAIADFPYESARREIVDMVNHDPRQAAAAFSELLQ